MGGKFGMENEMDVEPARGGTDGNGVDHVKTVVGEEDSDPVWEWQEGVYIGS